MFVLNCTAGKGWPQIEKREKKSYDFLMRTNALRLPFKHPELLLGGSVLFLVFFGVVAAVGNVFFTPIGILLALLTLLGSLASLLHIVRSSERSEKLLLTVSTLFILGLGYFAVPTVFTGRDQGSIAIAAIELSKNHSLKISAPIISDFFSFSGSGEALNFPGFHYTGDGNLVTKFPLGTTVFLASFLSLFGLQGFAIANTLLFLGSAFLIFLSVKKLRPDAAPYGLLLGTFSFLPVWFSKFTLSENLALFFFLFLAYSLVSFFQEKESGSRFVWYWPIVSVALLFPFVRIEGFAFLPIALLVLFSDRETRIFAKEQLANRILAPVLAFLSLLLLDFLTHTPFYRVMGKELFSFLQPGKASAESIGLLERHLDLLSLFSTYGLLPILLAGTIGIILALRTKNRVLLIPVCLALPTFLYFFSPSITPDHPWMLRRFFFSVWPSLLIIGSVAFALLFPLEKTKGRFIRNGVFFFLFLTQLLPVLLGAFVRINPNLLAETGQLAQSIGKDDRIFIDRLATGDGYAMISGPLLTLFGKQAAYFFNPADYAKLPKNETGTDFLLLPRNQEILIPNTTLEPIGNFFFPLEGLENVPLQDSSFPKTISATQTATLYKIIPLQ